MVKSATFEIIAGTYEEFLVGYNFSSKEASLVQSFAAHDHAASIRCVALSGHYIASGGADDRIFVYDFKARKEHCTLTHHNSTVTSLAFTENHSHLISGSEDGVLAIVRVGNWQLEKLWEKPHKGAAILDIAVHSSGKLALTLGANCSLCTWNLVKGRQAFIINLYSKSKDPRSLERILWAADGVRFILYGGKFTEIWSIESGGVLQVFEHDEKVTSCTWFTDEILLVGQEDGNISIINIDDKEQTTFKAHEARVKSIATYKKYIVSIASNGQIKVWNKKYVEVAKIDSGCRLTCLCVIPTLKVKEETEPTENEVIEDATLQKKITKPHVEIIEDIENEIVNHIEKKRKPKVVIENNHPIKRKKKKNKSKNTLISAE